MSAPIISVYLGPLRSKWDQYCLSKGVKSSSALKQVIRHLLSREFGSTPAVATDSVDGGKTHRVEIRLKSALYAELERRSAMEGLSPNRFISGLVDARLAKTVPVFGQHELDALTASTSQLLRLGTNLNQIARQLNISVESSDQLKLELIEQISKSINTHTQHVAGLIQANIKRWSIK